jgi:hypothetical protein
MKRKKTGGTKTQRTLGEMKQKKRLCTIYQSTKMELKNGRPEEANFVKKQVSQDVLPKELEAKQVYPPPPA